MKLTEYQLKYIIKLMVWEIETSDEFSDWYFELSNDETESVNRSVELLSKSGPALGRPHVDTLKGSRVPNLKELRVQHCGRPIRILFAFDPRRVGYLILGGDKTGKPGWYEEWMPRAEEIYAKHLSEMEEE